jgi:hypothetical protein
MYQRFKNHQNIRGGEKTMQYLIFVQKGAMSTP